MEWGPPTIGSIIIFRMTLMTFFWDPTKQESITFPGIITALLLVLAVVVVANSISIPFTRMAIEIMKKKVVAHKKHEVKDDWETHVMLFWMVATVASMMMPFVIVSFRA